MAGLTKVKDIVDGAYTAGQHWYSSFRKVPALASVGNTWVDLSMAPGNPKPNYYLGNPFTSSLLDGTYGLFHGGNVSPKIKFLQKMSIASLGAGVTPATFYICDYLMYYPLVDMDDTDQQDFINSVTLPRYTDGDGVKAFVVATNPYLGGATALITYTNSAGTSGQISQPIVSNTSGNIATLIHSGALAGVTGPFLRLAPGDVGIRSVQNITFYTPNGGLAALVLCKPLATIMTREITAFVERDFLLDFPSLPRIYDGAYLSLLCAPTGSVAAVPILGELHVIWN